MRTEEEKAHSRLRTEMHAAFESSEIFSATEETLQKYLASLCTERVPNEEVRHREIIKALTINHIQMQRHIDKLNKRNTILTYFVLFLSALVFISTIYQIYLQQSKPTAPIEQGILHIPSSSLETTDSISKTSKNSSPYIHPKAIQKNTSKEDKPLSINSGIKSESKYNSPTIKNEPKQTHK
jgi:hypothetical protein